MPYQLLRQLADCKQALIGLLPVKLFDVKLPAASMLYKSRGA